MAQRPLVMAAVWVRHEDGGCKVDSKLISISTGGIHHNWPFGRETLMLRRL